MRGRRRLAIGHEEWGHDNVVKADVIVAKEMTRIRYEGINK